MEILRCRAKRSICDGPGASSRWAMLPNSTNPPLLLGMLWLARKDRAPHSVQTWVTILLVVVIAQAGVGYVQYFSDVPPGSPARMVLRYPAQGADLLMSGFLQGAEEIAGKAAAVEVPVGRGRVLMFGFRPQYRGQSVATFKLLFNALLAGGMPGER